MFLGHLTPAEHNEIYCGCTGVIGHLQCKKKTSGPSQTKRTWDKDKWINKNNEYLLIYKEEVAVRPEDSWIEETQVHFFLPYECKVWTSPFSYNWDITSWPHLSPAFLRVAGEQLLFAIAIWRALNYFVRSLKVQCASATLKSWRECKKVDYCG